MPASRQPTASRFLGSVVRGVVPLLQLTRRPLRDILLQPCDDIPLGFFHSVAASLRSATAAARAPAGDDEREEDLGDALRSRLVGRLRRRRAFCRSRFPSLTISFLKLAEAFCQS